MTRAAWFCPGCQKHHAPHCDTCPGTLAAPQRPLPGIATRYPFPSSAGDVPFKWEPVTSDYPTAPPQELRGSGVVVSRYGSSTARSFDGAIQ